jgi:hypothetical protein
MWSYNAVFQSNAKLPADRVAKKSQKQDVFAEASMEGFTAVFE